MRNGFFTLADMIVACTAVLANEYDLQPYFYYN